MSCQRKLLFAASYSDLNANNCDSGDSWSGGGSNSNSNSIHKNICFQKEHKSCFSNSDKVVIV